jgi:phosphatidylinositol alpha-1,6-mannosyltransferase
VKILVVSTQYDPESGGCSRLLQEIVGGFTARRHEVEVLACGDPSLPGIAAFDKTQPYPIHRVAPQRRSGGSSAQMAFRLLSMSGRFDLVLCGVAFPSAILVSFACSLTGTPYVVYSHGEDVTVVRGTLLRRALVSAALRRARGVMTNSSFTRREVLSLNVPPEKVHWVPPSIGLEAFASVRPEAVTRLRDRYGLHGKRVILTVARIEARKGQDMIIRALAALRRTDDDLHYLIVGKGDATGLQALAQSAGVKDNVTFAGYVHEGDLPTFYHLCDVYAMVSRWDPATKEVEGFGIVYLEAAACGKPCVAGSDGGAADAVEHGVTGFVVDPNSVESVSDALRTLLSDPGKATAFGRDGQRRVHELFGKDNLTEQVERLLQPVGPAPSPAGPIPARSECP